MGQISDHFGGLPTFGFCKYLHEKSPYPFPILALWPPNPWACSYPSSLRVSKQILLTRTPWSLTLPWAALWWHDQCFSELTAFSVSGMPSPSHKVLHTVWLSNILVLTLATWKMIYWFHRLRSLKIFKVSEPLPSPRISKTEFID